MTRMPLLLHVTTVFIDLFCILNFLFLCLDFEIIIFYYLVGFEFEILLVVL